MRFVRKGEQRRPTDVIPFDGDARDHMGVTWKLSDFEGIDAELLGVLEQTRVLEQTQLESMHRTGYHVGFSISEDGCRKLGMKESKIRDLVDGVDFEVSAELPHYSKGAYKVVYQNRAFILMAAKEFNKLLRWLIPVNAVPWIESRMMIVVKKNALEPSGFKNRPVIDETDSGLNDASEKRTFSLPTPPFIIEGMGPASWMVKRDLENMFYNFRVHPRRWTLMGVRHPVTGQSYVMPVLPMGFTLSPPISCENTQLLADFITDEMMARWEGRAGNPALAHVPRRNRRPAGIRCGAPLSRVYVDDFMESAIEGWIQELIAVGVAVFGLVGVKEKMTKREGPAQMLILLGFMFCARTGLLSIPEEKALEMKVLLESILDSARRCQSCSWSELATIIGKFTWATPAVHCGKFYLRHCRKILIAVQDMLKRRSDREAFCIPMHHFTRALEELEWWEEVLRVGGGKTWFVGSDGKYAIWKWLEEVGVK
eukprot:3933731-Rhodomonas_salina.1